MTGDGLPDFAPWRRVHLLPERAPIRRLQPHEYPTPAQVRPRLERDGADPDSAGTILSAILRRGWTAWLVAAPGPPPRFHAYVLEPRHGAAWATASGATPAEALGAVLAVCLDEAPWPATPDPTEGER